MSKLRQIRQWQGLNLELYIFLSSKISKAVEGLGKIQLITALDQKRRSQIHIYMV